MLSDGEKGRLSEGGCLWLWVMVDVFRLGKGGETLTGQVLAHLVDGWLIEGR